MTPKDDQDSDKQDNSRKALMFVADGVLGAAVLVVLGVFAGNWLDAKLNTAPWWSVGLSILGGGLGLWRLCLKALALDAATRGQNPPGNRQSSAKSPLTRRDKSDEAAESSSGTSTAPKAAYEHFMDEERD